MKIVLILISMLALLTGKACDKKKTDASAEKVETSNCMANNLEAFKATNGTKGSTSVFTFESGGTTYTVFDNGIAFDAQAYVLNEACDTVHVYGGMLPPGTDVPDPPFKWEDMEKRTQLWPEK